MRIIYYYYCICYCIQYCCLDWVMWTLFSIALTSYYISCSCGTIHCIFRIIMLLLSYYCMYYILLIFYYFILNPKNLHSRSKHSFLLLTTLLLFVRLCLAYLVYYSVGMYSILVLCTLNSNIVQTDIVEDSRINVLITIIDLFLGKKPIFYFILFLL